MNKRYHSEKAITAKEFGSLSTDEKILKMTEGLTPPSGKSDLEVLDSILSADSPKMSKRSVSLRLVIQSVAAVAILVIGIYSVNKVFSGENIKTGIGSHASLTLPDGSTVNLNADSKISWNDSKFNTNREVKLSGEAYFEVKKGNQFNIKTKNGNVRILGTQLNVYSREKEFWVSCITGKVAVTHNSSEVILLPGEKAELTSSGLEKLELKDVTQTAAWKDGLFYFEDQPLVSIFAEMERQFGVKVHCKGDLKRKMTVTFSNKNLDEALDLVCTPMELTYEVEKNNTITISDKKSESAH